MDADASGRIREQVREAAAHAKPLLIIGGGTKQFYGRAVQGDALELKTHRGIIDYDPAELMIRARAGTPLSVVESALAAAGQCLPFEPPHFGEGATLGGTIACGLAGPARQYSGAIKDVVLGATVMNGEGKLLRFGGQVMKNVAGFDVARLMVGSLGTLGVLMDVSMKVLPRAPHSATRVWELAAPQALLRMNEWARQPSCISGSCWVNGRLYVRLSGSEAAIDRSAARMGGELHAHSDHFWTSVREHSHVFFHDAVELTRVTVPALCPPDILPGDCLMEWGGSQRWWKNPPSLDQVRQAARSSGGFATHFRARDRAGEVFEPVSEAQMRLQKSLKTIFDPAAIFNRGRIYADM